MKRLIAILVVATGSFTLAACEGNQSVLDAHGSSAVELKQLIIWIVAACSLVWAIVMVVLIWALWRSRGGRFPARSAADQRMTFAVIGGVAATVVVIAGFTIFSFLTTRALSEAGSGDLTIKISGTQWWWKATYVNPDHLPSFDIANELHIPVGRNIRLLLATDDVIHSLWVPSLAGKQDLIPGRSNQLAIRADQPGIYRGQCAEFCGLQHSHMAILVIVESEVAFDRWVDLQNLPAAEPGDAEARAGELVFLTKPCAACHTIRGTDAKGVTGPDLTHVGSRRTIGAGLFDTTRGSLAAWIADPQTLKPGNNMPLVPLSSDELRQVSAYLASLQ
jgi:cytochrome c oxidase subunit 2